MCGGRWAWAAGIIGGKAWRREAGRGLRVWARLGGSGTTQRAHQPGEWQCASWGVGGVEGVSVARPSLHAAPPSLTCSPAPASSLRRVASCKGVREGVSVGVCLASVCVTHHAHTFTRQSHARPCTPALGFVGPATLPYLRVGGGRCVCVPSTCGTVSPPSLRSFNLAFYATLT